jgi:hypothetical protein
MEGLHTRLAGLALQLGGLVPRQFRERARLSRCPLYNLFRCFLGLRLRRWRSLTRERGHKRLLLNLGQTHGYPLRVEQRTERQTRCRGGTRRLGNAYMRDASSERCDERIVRGSIPWQRAADTTSKT